MFRSLFLRGAVLQNRTADGPRPQHVAVPRSSENARRACLGSLLLIRVVGEPARGVEKLLDAICPAMCAC